MSKSLTRFAERIRELRGMRSQYEMASLVGGITQAAWAQWEIGARQPKLDVLYIICQRLGCSADWLLGLTDQREVNRKITNAQKFKQIFHISVEEVQPKDLSWWQEEYKDEIQV